MRYRLLPHSFKKAGWLLLLLTLITALFMPEIKGLNGSMPALINGELFGKVTFFTWAHENLSITLYGSLVLIGSMLICFSREKVEDEYLSALRLNALLWAVLAHSLLLLTAFLFVYGAAFIPVVYFSMFTPLFMFILRFHYLLYRYARSVHHEKHA